MSGAVQFTGANRREVLRLAYPDMSEDGLRGAEVMALPVVVSTGEGDRLVEAGEWVVRGADGILSVSGERPAALADAGDLAPRTPGEAAFRHYMTGGDRPDFARQAWLTLSFEVRDRWEEVAGKAIGFGRPPGWVDDIRQERDELRRLIDAGQPTLADATARNAGLTAALEDAQHVLQSIALGTAGPPHKASVTAGQAATRVREALEGSDGRS